jgi:hypothetical protein
MEKQIKKKKRNLYVLILVSPVGLKSSDIVFLDNKPNNLLEYTRGEGQALLFKLINFDCSTNFSEALSSGLFFQDYGAIYNQISFKQRTKQ